MDRKAIGERLQKIADEYFYDWKIGHTRHLATIAGTGALSSSRSGLGAAEVALQISRTCLTDMSTKYLNRCSSEHVNPGKYITTLNEHMLSFIQSVAAYYNEKHASGTFGDSSEMRRIFSDTYAEIGRWRESLIDDVKHGEIGTSVLYRHAGFIQRQWDQWLRGAVLSIGTGFLGGVISHWLWPK